jgi:uncharacterized membrane protein YoaK (UPF0700 family)
VRRGLAPVLGAIAGFVDTAGFLALAGLFTNHVTGNLVVAGAALGRERTDQFAIRIAMIPIFMVAVAATVVFVRRLRARGRPPIVPVLVAQLVLVLAFMALGVVLDSWLEESWAVLVVATAGVLAMGVQNAATRVVVGGTPTTIMTGNVTQLTIDLVEVMAPATGKVDAEARKRLAGTAVILAGFIAGAAAGALAMHALRFWSMAFPAAGLGAVAVGSRRE